MNLTDLPASAETDRLICEGILGWKEVRQRGQLIRKDGSVEPEFYGLQPSGRSYGDLPKVSRGIAAAWTVLNALRKKGLKVTLHFDKTPYLLLPIVAEK